MQAYSDSDGRFVFRGPEPVTYQLDADRTAPASSTVTTLPNGSHRIQHPHSRDWINVSSVQLPRTDDQPFELRDVPYK
jgi:hypothetical protein